MDRALLTPLFALAIVGLMSALPTGVMAQLMLPGAAPATAAPVPLANKAKPRAAPALTPSASQESIIGRPLFRNGAQGAIEFARDERPKPTAKSILERSERVIRVNRLTLEGELLSRPGEACRINVVSDNAVAAKSVGRPEGMWRYAIALDACPFSFDILDGAILVPQLPQLCVFAQADCQVDPSGLWGPAAAALGPDRQTDIEKSRARAENSLRANFRALLSRTHDGRQVKSIARQQAGFSSEREQLCRDYSGEDKHGFCAARITEARAASLASRLISAPDTDATAPKKTLSRHVKPTLSPASDPPPSE
jgi:hypothetical protein